MGKAERTRRPTREEKKRMSRQGLDWRNWLVSAGNGNDIACVSKRSGQKRTLVKQKGGTDNGR